MSSSAPPAGSRRSRPGHPAVLPSAPSLWPAVGSALALVLIAAGALGVYVDSRREAVESTSIEQGLELLRLERDLGAEWSRTLVAELDHEFVAGDSATARRAVERFDREVAATERRLQVITPTAAWSDVHERLSETVAEARNDLADEMTREERYTWGWALLSEFSGIFPADNRGRWSSLLETTRDAQYMVYNVGGYYEAVLARAWSHGDLSADGSPLVKELQATVHYLDEMGASDPESENPFDEALSVEAPEALDAEIVATLARVAADPSMDRVREDHRFLMGQSRRSWFSDVSEVAPAVLAVLDLVDGAGEETLQRAETLIMEHRSAVVRRGNLAAAGGGILVLLGCVLFFLYFRKRSRVEGSLRHAAEMDALTGLYNRFALFSRAAATLADPARAGFAVLHVDLDDFKAINDRYGHSAGDAALRLFARTCQTAIPGLDAIVARLGGDEFAVLLSSLVRPTEVAHVVSERILECLAEESVETAEGSFHVRATVGIATSDSPIDLDELLDQADAALLDGKEDRRSRSATFARNTRRNLVREIGLALADQRIQPAFQPIVRAVDFRVVELEGLARWRREDGSEVPPREFMRSLNALGDHERWFEILLAATERVFARFGDRFAGRIWLNVGADDLLRQGPASLMALLDGRGIPHDRLGLELMERVLPTDLTDSRRTLSELRERGIAIALDDLGSDTIPLRHLAELPLDRIKLDGPLIESIDTSHHRQQIVEGLLAIGTKLGLSVVAEKVETSSEERTLVQLGLPLLQGFRYGAALGFEDLETFFERARRRRELNATA